MSTPPQSTFATYSDSPRNVNRYLGQDYRFAPCYLRNRDPNAPQNQSNDTKPKENQGKYPLGSLWLNTVNRNMWLLVSLQAGTARNLAEWTLISQGVTTGPVLSLSDSTNTLVFPNTAAGFIGNIQLTAGAGISIVSTPGSNLLTISNTAAGGPTINTLTGDDSVAVGPTGGGTVNVIGNVVANATHAKAVSTFNSAANTERIDVQLAAAIASTDVTKVGLAAFNNTEFSVDANGFVSLLDNDITGSTTTIGAVTGDVITIALGATAGTYTFDCKIAGFCSTGSGGPLSAGYTIVGSVRTTGAAASVIGTPAVDSFEEGALSAGSGSLVASGNNAIFRVLGTVGKTIKWNAASEYVFATEP